MNDILVKVENIKKYFALDSGVMGDKGEVVHAVDDVSLEIKENETLALVGESGCGKSTLGRLLIRLLDPSSGHIYYKGEDISQYSNRKMRKTRKEMQIIFQDPFASLNPRMRIIDIIAEPLTTHIRMSQKEKKQRVSELMKLVGLRSEYMMRYPHMFSGGQRQRIGIARAIALNPKFIVCDEPVSALDVSIQSQVINLLQDLQEQKDLTYLFISHDLNIVSHISDRVCVMFLGKVMEIGDTHEVYEHPLHPYTKFLLAASPVPDPHLRNQKKLVLKGEIPSPIHVPSGCRFHTRCPFAREICKEKEPPLVTREGRSISCHFPLE
ncbi:ABC transporter ATP-binding protein [Sporolactobacillus nakayamae]|uniref:Oligopeptide transport system ATP-binding protein n=1 Tax=Sporolactobacillus nakayamae TaxID=269670 RepID=A0A1I2P293_9BACL|nr:dipeptide ABC transporter ATP-binding protein [Sporolactobacillus nakayamae]SFG07746.1 oligopeptide transport system ATP-binding protein [Sporolactobacillus nakayamae]